MHCYMDIVPKIGLIEILLERKLQENVPVRMIEKVPF